MRSDQIITSIGMDPASASASSKGDRGSSSEYRASAASIPLFIAV